MDCSTSTAVLDYWTNNETNLGPSFLQTADCPPSEWLPLLLIGIALWFATSVVCFLNAQRFNQYRWKKHFIYAMSRRLIYYKAIYSLTSVLIILNAKGAIYYEYIGDIFEAIVMVNFYHLIWSYTGGIETTIKKLMGLEINLGQPPCCCLRFLSNVKINENFLKLMEGMLLQLPFVQIFIGMINITLISAGLSSTLFEHWATTLTNIILTLSAMMSIYGIGMLYACWAQFVYGRSLKSKFGVFKAVIILAKVQTAIFGALGNRIEQSGYYSGANRAAMWSAFLVTVECLIFAIADSFLYKTSDYDTQNSSIDRVGYRKNEEGLEGDGMEEVDLGKPSLVITNPNI